MASPIPGDTHLLLLTWIVTVVMQLSFFTVAAYFKFDKVTDFAGGTNFVLLAILTLTVGENYHWRQVAVTCCVVAWGLRLSAYLLYRIIKIGKDDRFDDTRESFWKFLGFWVFQMIWVWTVSLPVTFLNTTETDPGVSVGDVAGLAMYAVGLVVETVADQQKFKFKMENRGGFCNVGLWGLSRHPNYFGELLLWWGLFTTCATVFGPAGDEGEGDWGYATIAGPLLLMTLLLFVSGIPPLEQSSDSKYGAREEYREWKERTSVLVPLPPALFEGLPQSAKAWLFCEWPMYQGITPEGMQGYEEAKSSSQADPEDPAVVSELHDSATGPATGGKGPGPTFKPGPEA